MSEHTTSQPQLVKMANQIGLFFDSQTPTDAAAAAQALAAHLKLFWAPSMRSALVDQVERGDTEGADAIVLTAVRNHRRTLLNEHVHVAAEQTQIGPEGGGDAG